jgi:hypothetical protein
LYEKKTEQLNSEITSGIHMRGAKIKRCPWRQLGYLRMKKSRRKRPREAYPLINITG